ncbi:MAG TPA: hypothetical protein VF601_03615 [Beijerinckiaceae bacterium]|jgi:hypothetical protein
MRLLGRLLLLVLGLAIAVPFGALTFAIGVGLEPAARELAGTLGAATLRSILADLSAGEPPDERAVVLLTAFATGVSALLIAPPSFAAVVGEVLGRRSLLWYAGGSGALTALLPWLGRVRSGMARAADAALRAEGRITLVLFCAGAASGLVYWAVAGRSAGRRSPSPAPPVRP